MDVKRRDSTHEVYHRILQPVYERMVIQHVFKNKINLKSGATSQLLQKRPKTTGYLGRKRHFTEIRRLTATPSTATYWKPGTYDQWQWNSKAGSTVLSVQMMQDGRSVVYPRLTDDRNIKASTMSNTFSATTKVREVPVSGIYKKEIQEFRCTSPSVRGVRSIPLTNRSLIAPPQSMKSSYISGREQMKGSHQVVRLVREQERMERTREMKRQAQIAAHRMDRMYYMNGAPAKLYSKYDVTDGDLERLQAIAVSRGVKLSQTPTTSYHSRSGPKSTSVPNSSPRDAPHRGSDVESGTKTIIPTADVMSVGGDLASEDGTVEIEKVTTSGREDAATSDHENEDERSKVDSEVKDEVTSEVKGEGSEATQESAKEESEKVIDEQKVTEGSEVTKESLEQDENIELKENEKMNGIEVPEKEEKAEDELSVKSDSMLLSPGARNAPLAVSGAFLTDMTGDD